MTGNGTVPAGYKRTEVGVIPKDWRDIHLGQAVTFQRGFDLPHKLRKAGQFPVVSSAGITDFHNEAIISAPGVVTGRYGTIGQVFLINERFWPLNTTLYVKDFHGNHPEFIYYSLQRFDFFTFSGKSGVPGVNRNDLHAEKIAIPADIEEQQAIAEALSDVDALLNGLDRLIAKKRDLKQAAMQQLLTGKTRLPGFDGKWAIRQFNEVLERINAKKFQIQANEYQSTGRYPVVDQGKERVVGFSDFSGRVFECPTKGVIVFGDHTCIIKFIDFDFIVGADGTQIIYAKANHDIRFLAYQLQINGIESTGYNRHFKFLREIPLLIPPSDEQTAIAEVLSDMDAEIAALEARRDKTRALKQGMMQELLTGRIRLVSPQPTDMAA